MTIDDLNKGKYEVTFKDDYNRFKTVYIEDFKLVEQLGTTNEIIRCVFNSL